MRKKEGLGQKRERKKEDLARSMPRRLFMPFHATFAIPRQAWGVGGADERGKETPCPVRTPRSTTLLFGVFCIAIARTKAFPHGSEGFRVPPCASRTIGVFHDVSLDLSRENLCATVALACLRMSKHRKMPYLVDAT